MTMVFEPYPGCCGMTILHTVGPVHGTSRKESVEEFTRHMFGSYIAVYMRQSVYPYIQRARDHGADAALNCFVSEGVNLPRGHLYRCTLHPREQDVEIGYLEELGWKTLVETPYRQNETLVTMEACIPTIRYNFEMGMKDYDLRTGRAFEIDDEIRECIGLSKSASTWKWGLVVDDEVSDWDDDLKVAYDNKGLYCYVPRELINKRLKEKGFFMDHGNDLTEMFGKQEEFF